MHTNNPTIRSVTVSTLNPSNVIEVTPSLVQTAVTENRSDVTVTVTQAIATIPTSSGFIPLASNPAVISAGSAGVAHKELKAREVNVFKTTNLNVFKTVNYNVNHGKSAIRHPHYYLEKESVPETPVYPPEPRATYRGEETNIFSTIVNININTPTKTVTTKPIATTRWYPHRYYREGSIPDQD